MQEFAMFRNILAQVVAVAMMAFAMSFSMVSSAHADIAADVDAVLADTTLTNEQLAEAIAEIVINAEDPGAAAQIIAEKVAAMDPPLSDERLAAVGNGLGLAVIALNETNPVAASEVAAVVVTMSEEVQTAFAETVGQTATIVANRRNDLFTEATGDKSAN
jgi:hypothetical protein